MRELFRCIRGELVKMCHTFLYPLHIGVPLLGSLVFLLYYKSSGWNDMAQISGFFQIIGIALPFAASIVCAGNVELEEANHFQVFLGNGAHKWKAFLAKWMTLWGLSVFGISAAVFLFALGYQFVLLKEGIFLGYYAVFVLILSLGSGMLYLIHLFLNLMFPKQVSLCVGVAQFLLASLFLTGLGDQRWQFFPGTWSARGVSLALAFVTQREYADVFMEEVKGVVPVCLLIMGISYAIIRIWFHYYEGRRCND